MGWIQRFKTWREYEKRAVTLEELILQAGIGVDTVTKEQALNIPSVAGCVEIISNTVAMLPINLYKDENGQVSIVDNDIRVSLLNDDTKDTLNAYQFKKQLIEDYLLAGNGYAYINKDRNKVKSLHYVDEVNVSVNKNVDPIFKSCDVLVNGATYRDFEFLKLTRKTKDGVTGKGIVDEHNDMLSVAYLTMKYEKILLKTGGNKKGFLKAKAKLSPEALEALKTAWNNLYKDNTENVIVLNDGVDFQEASSTSVEMQMNENKRTNSAEVSKLFSVPVGLLEGNVTDDQYKNFIKLCILPILKAFETSLNKDLLLESEKGQYYFAFDTRELLKGDIEKLYRAYEIAIKNGFMQWDEVRYELNYRPYGLNFIKLGLQDVLYNVETKEIYTPNTNKTSNLNNLPAPERGDIVEN
ncbi:phage portal protein [Schinkia azotoformans]|uniref:phage portal protein n=1 Tax=Schinkia azotoformans TaxID=1454 RepID=UPI002DBBEA3B|nr:phage portal protein [Schinkia azotoformans]MEC1757386.1 phage portal protein [Schinkia azotoformans]